MAVRTKKDGDSQPFRPGPDLSASARYAICYPQ